MDGKRWARRWAGAAIAALAVATVAPASASADAPMWFLRNANSDGLADTSFRYGNPGDTPLAGDWNGDGIDTPGAPGLYRRSNATFYLADHFSGSAVAPFRFGTNGNTDDVLVGDWNGDGYTSIGLFRRSTYTWTLSNYNGTGASAFSFRYGNPGDVPIVGDWDGNGTDTPGVVRTMPGAAPYPVTEGQLVREAGTSTVYYSEGGELYPFASPAIVEAAGFALDSVAIAPDGSLASITRGDQITLEDLDGTLENNDAPDTESDPDYSFFSSSYVFLHEAPFDFTTGDGRVAAIGSTLWYRGKKKRYIKRIAFAKGSGVHPQRPVGCMWVKIKFGYPAGSFSLPGGGVSISGASTEQGYAIRCRKPGDDYPGPIKLGGVAYAKAIVEGRPPAGAPRAPSGGAGCSPRRRGRTARGLTACVRSACCR